MIEIKCRNCGNTDLKFEDGFYVCPFCGSRYLPEIWEIPDSLIRNNEVSDDDENDDLDEDCDLEEWEDFSDREDTHDMDDPKNTGDFNTYDGIGGINETTDSIDVETEETADSTDNVTDPINDSTEEIVFSFEKNKKSKAVGKTTATGYQSKSKQEEHKEISGAVTFVAVILLVAFGVYYLLKATFEVSKDTGFSIVIVGVFIFCIFAVIGVILYIKNTISDIKKKKK